MCSLPNKYIVSKECLDFLPVCQLCQRAATSKSSGVLTKQKTSGAEELKINVLQTVAELVEFDITSSNKTLKDKKVDDDEWEKISENKAVTFTHFINRNSTVKTLAVMNAYAVQLIQI